MEWYRREIQIRYHLIKGSARVPKCLKSTFHGSSAEEILDDMRQIVATHSYLPQGKNLEFRRKYNFSVSCQRHIFFSKKLFHNLDFAFVQLF